MESDLEREHWAGEDAFSHAGGGMEAGSGHHRAGWDDSADDRSSAALERHTDGRIRRRDLSSTDRALGVVAHLWWLLIFTPIGFFAPAVPIVLWLAFRGRNHFVSDHGQEALNSLVSLLILHVVLLVTFVGVALWPVLWIYAIVGIVRAAVAAGGGEYFRYPITIRLL